MTKSYHCIINLEKLTDPSWDSVDKRCQYSCIVCAEDLLKAFDLLMIETLIARQVTTHFNQLLPLPWKNPELVRIEEIAEPIANMKQGEVLFLKEAQLTLQKN